MGRSSAHPQMNAEARRSNPGGGARGRSAPPIHDTHCPQGLSGQEITGGVNLLGLAQTPRLLPRVPRLSGPARGSGVGRRETGVYGQTPIGRGIECRVRSQNCGGSRGRNPRGGPTPPSVFAARSVPRRGVRDGTRRSTRRRFPPHNVSRRTWCPTAGHAVRVPRAAAGFRPGPHRLKVGLGQKPRTGPHRPPPPTGWRSGVPVAAIQVLRRPGGTCRPRHRLPSVAPTAIAKASAGRKRHPTAGCRRFRGDEFPAGSGPAESRVPA